MSPPELHKLMVEYFQEANWQTPLARLLDLNVTTVNRWATGKVPIPKDTAMLVTLLVMSQRKGIALPGYLLERAQKAA